MCALTFHSYSRQCKTEKRRHIGHMSSFSNLAMAAVAKKSVTLFIKRPTSQYTTVAASSYWFVVLGVI
jgi:hypothetical protein